MTGAAKTRETAIVTYVNQYIERLAELDRLGQPFVSVTLIETIGSAPQDAGSKMLVDRHGLAFGTVGGGKVELKALELAQQLLHRSGHVPTSVFVEWNLQRDVGMTCGGVVKLYFEVFNRRSWHIVIFGAGHVAQSLVRTLLSLDCQVTCIDPREEWLSRLPSSAKLTVKRTDELAEEVSAGSPEVSLLMDRLVGEVHRLQGDDAVLIAVKAMAAGQALSRIDDHARILGARLRYLFTGDPDHLAAEVR